jgi:hypothetical protein
MKHAVSSPCRAPHLDSASQEQYDSRYPQFHNVRTPLAGQSVHGIERISGLACAATFRRLIG